MFDNGEATRFVTDESGPETLLLHIPVGRSVRHHIRSPMHDPNQKPAFLRLTYREKMRKRRADMCLPLLVFRLKAFSVPASDGFLFVGQI